ncbi:MAG: Mu transposase C-terminal domain-containing protein [Synergistaceae bacterium]|nr:Mu transposase C-terminal domain-containing protein [Synergistaceae bacterium]
MNITERAVQKAIAEGRYTLKQQVSGVGRGGKVWQISALDPAVPDRVREALGLGSNLETLKKTMEEAQKVEIAPERLDEKTALRFRVLKLAGECPPGVTLGDWYAKIAAEAGVSVPTIYRWLDEKRKGKLTSDRAPVPVALKVESGPLSAVVRSHSFAPQALEYGFALLTGNPNMDVKRAYHETAAEAEKRGWEIGSLPSFYRRWNDLPDAAKVCARSGGRGVEAMVKPSIERDLSLYKVYEWLCGDQHIFDYTVFDDDGAPIRPQMFAWVDMRSRYFSGVWPVLGDYDQYAVGFALREACRWGIPDTLYTDWGKPERSGYVARLREQLGGYALFAQKESDNEVEHVKAKPRNAQAKPIESYFKHAVEGALLQKGLPGYSRQDKQDEKRNEAIQRKLREEIKGKKLLHVKEFFEIVMKTLDEWHKHTLVEARIQPELAFLEGIAGRPSLARFNDATLDFLFWPAMIRQVRHSTVEATLPGFGKCRWFAPELAMAARGNKKPRVEVRFNPYDAAVVHCVDIESRTLLCAAERWDKVDPHDRDTVTKRIRAQNELNKWIQDMTRQLTRPDVKVHRYTPYAAAAAEVKEIGELRERLTVNDAELNKKLINIGKRIEPEAFAPLAKTGG